MDSHTLMLREIPNEDRPRERLLQFGAHALSNAELLAILLRTGTVAESAVKLATKLLANAGGLRNLVGMTIEQFTTIRGIGEAKAIQLQASIEIGRRLASARKNSAYVVKSPKDAADYVMEDLRYLDKEHFVVLFLNTKNHVTGHETLSVGSLNASIVHPREVFCSAIKRSSASIICVHNHPSGDPTPSPEDVEVTRRLSEAGRIVGIDVLDHIIIADRTFLSLKEQGLM
ncbi:MAG: DNA repair protein RadC [Paenibacillaceae bacterium]